MREEDIIEILELFRKAGLRADLCDTPVPYYPGGVSAGVPKEIISQCEKEYVMIPRYLLGNRVYFYTEVNGDSMVESNIFDKDVICVEVTDHYFERQIVVTIMDGQCVLKVYHQDNNGDIWLIPRNKSYKPIRLRDYDDVRIIGVLANVQRNPPVIDGRDIDEAMNRVDEALEKEKIPTDEEVRETIEFVMPTLDKNSRLWFCVYRALLDKRYLSRSGLELFEEKMKMLFPDRELNINIRDLSRLEIGCFRKPIRFWREYDAPVRGKPYERYLAMGEKMLDML